MASQIRNERLRQKLLAVLGNGDVARLQYMLFHLNGLVEAEAICDWLVANKLTGKRLDEWITTKFGGFFLPMYDHVRAKILTQNFGKPVRLGVDVCRN